MIKVGRIAFVFASAFILSGLGVPSVRAEDAVLRGNVVDVQSGRTKASFVASTPITTPPSRESFSYQGQARLPKPIGQVTIAAQLQFLGFSKTSVWFAINTDVAATEKRVRGVRRTIKSRAFIPYGQSYTIADIFSANGHRLSLVITASKGSPHKPAFSLWRIFARGQDR